VCSPFPFLSRVRSRRRTLVVFPLSISALALLARCPHVPLRLSSSSLSTCRLPSHLSQHIILFLGRHPHLADAILATPCTSNQLFFITFFQSRRSTHTRVPVLPSRPRIGLQYACCVNDIINVCASFSLLFLNFGPGHGQLNSPSPRPSVHHSTTHLTHLEYDKSWLWIATSSM